MSYRSPGSAGAFLFDDDTRPVRDAIWSSDAPVELGAAMLVESPILPRLTSCRGIGSLTFNLAKFRSERPSYNASSIAEAFSANQFCIRCTHNIDSGGAWPGAASGHRVVRLDDHPRRPLRHDQFHLVGKSRLARAYRQRRRRLRRRRPCFASKFPLLDQRVQRWNHGEREHRR